jgi:hypothetical protein
MRSASRPGDGSSARPSFHSSGMSSRSSMIRCARASTASRPASRSSEGSVGSGNGSIRAMTAPSSSSRETSRARTTPATIACLPSRAVSTTRATRVRQPTEWSSERPGSSSSGSTWVATSRNPEVPARSSAANEAGRPITSGTDIPGKTAAPRTGRSGTRVGTSRASPPAAMIRTSSASVTAPPRRPPMHGGPEVNPRARRNLG